MRKVILAAALIAAIAVANEARLRVNAQSDVSEPVVRNAPSSSASSEAARPVAPHMFGLEPLGRDTIAPSGANPFATRSWYVAPAAPPIVSAAAPPAPTAPALPFTFAGMLEVEPGRVVYYLARGDQSFAVAVGETIEGTYRLDAVENGRLVITYLPLTTRQFLSMNLES